jgi:5-methyltetrahydropteroyltriglutamate--homocysteine methyltransferase
MRRSTDHILVSHAGTLPRPPELEHLLAGPATAAEFEACLPEAIKQVVQRQVEIGVNVVNDGEFGKVGGFAGYVRDRMSGLTQHPLKPGQEPYNANKRDALEFPGAYAAYLDANRRRRANGAAPGQGANVREPYFCTAPLRYIGAANVRTDIDRLKAAVKGLDVEPYLPAVAPGRVEHWLWNEHYPTDEAFLFAIADVMHEEYKAITDAGIVLQIDDPGLPDGW